MATMNDEGGGVVYLPTDIIDNILSRLPVKSLLILKSVSKSWNALISGHPFITTHLLRSRTLLIAKTSPKKFSFLRLQNGKMTMKPVTHAPSAANAILCSCNGLLLLSAIHSDRQLILWNPSTRNFSNLRFPYKFPENASHRLCYDPAAADLKIVVASWEKYAVYSCKNRSWNKHEGFACSSGKKKWILDRDGVCVNGAEYWVSKRHVGSRVSFGDLVCFDSDGDSLKTVQKPRDLKRTNNICVICLRGRLCAWFASVRRSVVRVWMKEGGVDRNDWTEHMRFEKVLYPATLVRPLFVEENNIVVRYVMDGIVYAYRHSDKEVCRWYQEFKCRSNKLFDVEMLPYVESVLFFSSQQDVDQPPRTNRKRPRQHDDDEDNDDDDDDDDDYYLA